MKQYTGIIFFVLILGLFLFFRLYQFEQRYQFTWDQIENAWVMKTAIIDGKMPVKGMEAKGSTGFSMGPGFYYVLLPFFQVLQLSPISGGVFTVVSTVIAFILLLLLIFYIADKTTVLFASVLFVFSYHIILFDRISWPVVLVPLVSFCVFFSLWKVLQGHVFYYVILGLSVGLAFHLHMTALYFPFICLFMMPFFPWKKKHNMQFLFLGTVLLIIFIAPIIIVYLSENGIQIQNASAFGSEQFHGLHLRRVLQLLPDAFIEYSGLFNIPSGFLFYCVLFLMGIIGIMLKWGWKQSYLVCVWFAVPLFIMSLFKGEITQYYFSTTRYVVVFLTAFLCASVWKVNNTIVRSSIVVLVVLFVYYNISIFVSPQPTPYKQLMMKAEQDVKNKKAYQFVMGDPYSYILEWSVYKKYGKWPKENDWLIWTSEEEKNRIQ